MNITLEVTITPETYNTVAFYTIVANGKYVCKDLVLADAMPCLESYLDSAELTEAIRVESRWHRDSYRDSVWEVISITEHGIMLCSVTDDTVDFHTSRVVSENTLRERFTCLLR